MHANRKIVTLTAIAKQVGVSQPVVSKVLHGGSISVRVGEETATKIRDLAKSLGYRPNLAAKAIRSGKFGAAGLLLGTARSKSMLPDGLMNGILGRLTHHGLHLTIAQLPDEQLVSEGFIPKILRECVVDGLLINYNAEIPPPMIELIGQQQIPAVWINSQQKSDCVYFDDYGAARDLTEHLLSLGHKRIVFSNFGGEGHYSAIDRAAGYVDAMEKAGLEPCFDKLFLAKNICLTHAAQGLTKKVLPTAVITYNPETCRIWIKALQQSGKKIPEDVSLATFSDRIEHDIDLSITTALLPESIAGGEAVDMLLQRIKAPSEHHPPKIIPVKLVPGASTGPARGAIAKAKGKSL